MVEDICGGGREDVRNDYVTLRWRWRNLLDSNERGGRWNFGADRGAQGILHVDHAPESSPAKNRGQEHGMKRRIWSSAKILIDGYWRISAEYDEKPRLQSPLVCPLIVTLECHVKTYPCEKVVPASRKVLAGFLAPFFCFTVR